MLVAFFGAALHACGGCPSKREADDAAPPVDGAPSAPLESLDPTTVQRTRVRVHSRTELATLDLNAIRELDIALSPVDLVGHLDATDPETVCEGLDLFELARATRSLRTLRLSGCAAQASGLEAFRHIDALELGDAQLDAGMVAQLSTLDQLETLTLQRIVATDASLRALERLTIRRLHLEDLDRDSALATLVSTWHRSLKEIHMQGPWASHGALTPIGSVEGLERLDLIDTRATNYSLHAIKSLPRLTELNVRSGFFNDATPLYLQNLPLERLRCECPRWTDAALRGLRKISTISSLLLPGTSISGSGLEALTGFSELSELVLDSAAFHLEALEPLASLPRLRRLEIHGQLADDSRFGGLETLQSLQDLQLHIVPLDDRIAPGIGTLVNLERLIVPNASFTDEGLAEFSQLLRLRVLDLSGSRITARGLESLRGAADLEILRLDRTDVLDEALAVVGSLRKLQELTLSHTLITDAGLEHLEHLEHLERLDLSHTVVSDAGVEFLKKLPKLQLVGLEGTRSVNAR